MHIDKANTITTNNCSCRQLLTNFYPIKCSRAINFMRKLYCLPRRPWFPRTFPANMSPCQFGQNMHLASLAAPCCYFVLDIDIERRPWLGAVTLATCIGCLAFHPHYRHYISHVTWNMDMPRIPRLVSLLSFRLSFGNNPITCPLALHSVHSVHVLSQVAVRGAAAEVPLQQTGLQPRPARRDGGQDPPLVQLHQLAADGVGPDQARVHPRPARRVRQGENQDNQETVRIHHQPRTGLETADILQSCRQQCSQIIWASFNI